MQKKYYNITGYMYGSAYKSICKYYKEVKNDEQCKRIRAHITYVTLSYVPFETSLDVLIGVGECIINA